MTQFHRGFLLLILGGRFAFGQCYLDDSSAACPVCWTTNQETQVRELALCPKGIEAEWMVPPPEKIFTNEEYFVRYSLYLDRARFHVIPKVDKFQYFLPPVPNSK